MVRHPLLHPFCTLIYAPNHVTFHSTIVAVSPHVVFSSDTPLPCVLHSFSVTGLRPGTRYRLIVFASNDKGPSERYITYAETPEEVAQGITAPDTGTNETGKHRPGTMNLCPEVRNYKYNDS